MAVLVQAIGKADLEQVAARLRDKKPTVRKEAALHLMGVYR